MRKVVRTVLKVGCFPETTSVFGVDGNSAGLFFLFAPRPWLGQRGDGPAFPFVRHSIEAFGLFFGEIVQFRAVGFDVVQFPRAGCAFGDEFPFAVAHGAVAFVLPVDWFFAPDLFAVERRGERGALHRDDCRVADFFRVGRLAKVNAGGHEVDEVAGLAFEFAVPLFADAAWPMSDERRADAAFVHPMLVLAERRVAGVGPGEAVAVVGVRAAGHHAGALLHHATIAGALARAGAAVAVAARSEKEGKLPGTIGSVAARIVGQGGRAIPVPCDVTSEQSVDDAVTATVAEFGGIDILVANAGVLWLGPVESTPLKRWQLCLDVNTTGVFLVTKAVIPHLRTRGGGSLIAITTTGVTMIEHGANAYWVSKAAVERLYLGLATDLRPDNIAVNCLSPSRVVITEGWQAGGGGMQVPPEMIEPPEAMADAAVRLAQQDAAGVTGTIQRSEALTF
mgnify:CR=1 FL=1